MTRLKVRADLILHALSKRHHEDTWLTEVKTGSTMHTPAGELGRFDGLAIKKSWSKPCITGYEVKVDRQDFLRDEKWPMYRSLCHRFYFAAPVGLIAPEELADDVGLITFNPENGSIRTAKKATFRSIEISSDLLYYIVISRTDNDRHPFFSSAREQLEAWLYEKDERRTLGRNVRSKLIREIESLRLTSRDSLREQAKLMEQVQEEVSQYGLHLFSWNQNWRDELRRMVSNGTPPRVVRDLRFLAKNANDLLALMEVGDDHEQAR